jgi:hypothetical protein
MSLPSAVRSAPALRRSLALLALAVGLLAATPAQAQRTSGAVGIGGQVGSPSGLTLKVFNDGGLSYDFLAAWDLNDRFFLNVHGQYNNAITAENIDGLGWFIGPGAFIGIVDRGSDVDDDVFLGISGRLGLNFVFAQRFELYGQITPRLNLIPNTDGDIGGGLGFRFYF